MIFLYTWWFLLKGNVGYWPSKLDMLFCRTPCIAWIEENSIEATVTIFLLIFIWVNAVNLMRYWNIRMIKSYVKQIQMEISAGFLLMPWFICRNASFAFLCYFFLSEDWSIIVTLNYDYTDFSCSSCVLLGIHSVSAE